MTAPPSTRTTALAHRLADFQVARPGVPLLCAGVLAAVALLLALRLRVQAGFDTLLPESRPSVVELDRVARRTAGVSTLFVVLEGGKDTSTPALRRAADALVPAIESVGPPWVGSVEDGVHDAYAFLAPRAGLHADKEKLEKLRGDVEARFQYEVSREGGLLLDDGEPPPPLDVGALRRSLGLGAKQRYPDGYYEAEDGKTVVVAVRSKVLNTDLVNGSEAIRRVRAAVDRVSPASFDPGITVGYAGDLQTGISEYAEVNKDLTDVGYLGAALVAGVVLLYYLRFRALVAMLISVGVGIAWTFGITELCIGHLNLATGFLFAIFVGNGSNFGVIYLARFLEARHRGETLAGGLRTAHRETWRPTLTAAVAAAASYGSLLVTEFRGFRDFGAIGAIGMLLCWIATYVALPPILVISERISPIRSAQSETATRPGGRGGAVARLRRLTRGGMAFGKPFAAVVPRAPRAIAAVGVGLAVLGLVGTVLYARADPMEYDLGHLRTDESARAREIALGEKALAITGYVGASGMAILVDRPDQVAPLSAELRRRRDQAGPGQKPFEEVHALQDFVPGEQASKIPILLAIKARVVRAHQRGMFSADEWRRIEPVLPPDDLVPFGIDDLPTGMARLFTETDGTRGRIVYISPTRTETVDDARYLFRWADAYRETRLPDGATIRGSGRAVIYADMWAAVLDDVPPAIVLSFGATVIVVLFAFRGRRGALAVLAALLVGVGWMLGLLVLAKVKLNFLNFIALPITFGIGVDYAVNVTERYAREGAGGAVSAVASTGGAVILCSVVTCLGYAALMTSINGGVRSLGAAAVLGEISCLLAAVLVLPAGLSWLDRSLPAGPESALSARREGGT